MGRRMSSILALSLGLSLLPISSVFAKRLPVHEAAESPEYGRKAKGMLGRGLLNVVTCFMDLIVDTVNETRTGPPLVGTLTGVAKGAGCTVLRAGSGVIDVVTFWVPGFNGFPVSDSYDNCVPANASMAKSAAPETTASAPAFDSSSQAASLAEPGASTSGTAEIRPKRVWKK